MRSRSWRLANRRPIALVGSLVAIVLLTSGPTPTEATSPLGDRFVFRDAVSAATLNIDLSSGSAAGRFTFGHDSLGLVSGDGRAALTQLLDGRILVSYTGPAHRDALARFDPIFALHQASGIGDAVDVVLAATLRPSDVTGHAAITVGLQPFVLDDPGRLPGAGLLLDRVVAATRSEDWAALWDDMSGFFREGTTEAEFTAGVAAGFAPIGHVVAVAAGPVAQLDGQAGYDLASAPISATLERTDGSTTTVLATLGMTWESGRWAVLTISVDP